MKYSTRFVATVIVAWLLGVAAFAHDLPISNMAIVVDQNAVHLELVLNAEELSFFSEIDTNNDGLAGLKEVEAKSEQISKTIVDCFKLLIDGKPAPAAVYGVVPDIGTHHLTIRAHYSIDAREMPVHLTSDLAAITQRAHVVEVTFRRPNVRQAARLDAHSREVLFDFKKKKVVTADASVPASPKNVWLGNNFLVVGLVALLMGIYLVLSAKIRK
jgi:hypothetical protein